jgi:hypothetical protein
MKLIYDSLGAMLAELRDRKVEAVWVSPAIQPEPGRRRPGIPRFTSRIIVTARIDEHLWAEWRLWVGSALAELGERGPRLPEPLRLRSEHRLKDVKSRIEAEGFRTREGLLAHDSAAMDVFGP